MVVKKKVNVKKKSSSNESSEKPSSFTFASGAIVEGTLCLNYHSKTNKEWSWTFKVRGWNKKAPVSGVSLSNGFFKSKKEAEADFEALRTGKFCKC